MMQKMSYFYWSDLKRCKITFSMNARAKPSMRKAGRVREKRTLLCQTQVLESVSVGQSLPWGRLRKGTQQNSPLRPLLVTQHTSHHSSRMGRHRRETEQRQWEEPHRYRSRLCRWHGPRFLLPGPWCIVLHPELEAGRSDCLLLPRQRREKESRDGWRKAAILMGFAFKKYIMREDCLNTNCVSVI